MIFDAPYSFFTSCTRKRLRESGNNPIGTRSKNKKKGREKIRRYFRITVKMWRHNIKEQVKTELKEYYTNAIS